MWVSRPTFSLVMKTVWNVYGNLVVTLSYFAFIPVHYTIPNFLFLYFQFGDFTVNMQLDSISKGLVLGEEVLPLSAFSDIFYLILINLIYVT